MLPWVVKDDETVPHTVEVVAGSHPRLPSDLRQQKFPVYRQYDLDDYRANPVSRGDLPLTPAATDTYNRRSCVGAGVSTWRAARILTIGVCCGRLSPYNSIRSRCGSRRAASECCGWKTIMALPFAICWFTPAPRGRPL